MERPRMQEAGICQLRHHDRPQQNTVQYKHKFHKMELVMVLDLLCSCYSFLHRYQHHFVPIFEEILTVLNLCLTDKKLIKINANYPHTYTEHQKWTCEKKKNGRALSSSSCSNAIRDLTRILTFRCGYSSIKTLCWHPLGLGHPGQI